MSRKEKATVLYSRNGIRIDKIEFIDMTKYENQKNLGILVKNVIELNLKKKNNNIEIIPAKKRAFVFFSQSSY